MIEVVNCVEVYIFFYFNVFYVMDDWDVGFYLECEDVIWFEFIFFVDFLFV